MAASIPVSPIVIPIMAAPSRPSSGGRPRRRQDSHAGGEAARRGWVFVVLSCTWISTVPGCALWREARDSLDHSQGLCRRALESEARGERGEAVRLLRESIAASPDDPELRWELARVLLDQGNTNAALLELRYLVKNYPHDSRAYITLSRTLLERDRAEDAARLVDLAIDLDSHCTEALLLRGQIAEVRGDLDLARETYHRILLEQPEHGEVRIRLGRIELEHGDLRVASAFLRETLADVPLTTEQVGTAQWMLGTAYARAERWAEAASALSLGLPPTHATPRQRYELAFACFQAGNRERAREQAALVLNAEPDHVPAREMLVELKSIAIESSQGPSIVLPTTHTEQTPVTELP